MAPWQPALSGLRQAARALARTPRLRQPEAEAAQSFQLKLLFKLNSCPAGGAAVGLRVTSLSMSLSPGPLAEASLAHAQAPAHRNPGPPSTPGPLQGFDAKPPARHSEDRASDSELRVRRKA